MIFEYVVIALAVGFIQGFVGIATTLTLARPLAALITDTGSGYSFEDTEPRARFFEWVAVVVAFIFLVVLHIVVLEVILGTLSGGDRKGRAELGQLWIFACIAGIALSRLLPELESKIRGAGPKR